MPPNMWDSGFTEIKLDYEGTKNLAIGDAVLSNRIFAGGNMWIVRCYPHGDDEDNNGVYLSLFLKLLGRPSTNAKAIFEVFLMCRDGLPSRKHSRRCLNVFSADGSARGYSQFIRRSDLESDYMADGQVTFMCGVIVLGDKIISNPIAVPPSDICEHFGSLLDATDTSDVSFSVGGETFPAHRAVLAARSPVFRAQLYGPMADAKMPCITLPEIQASTFRVLMQFMYTDVLPSLPTENEETELFQNLLTAADMYHMDRLKLLCSQKLWASVSAENVATILGLAETHSCQELKSRCLDFFVMDENFKIAVLTEGFFHLMQNCPSVIDEIRARVRKA